MAELRKKNKVLPRMQEHQDYLYEKRAAEVLRWIAFQPLRVAEMREARRSARFSWWKALFG